MNKFLVTTSLAALLSWAGSTELPATEKRPNILLIFVDDLGYGELGCQGNQQIPTPNIDSLAENGIRFTDGYVTASYCSPSRAGVLTGRYQTRFGHELNPVGEHNRDPRAGLPLSERTLAAHLKQAGYATALIGKWHLGARDKFHPLNRGFDEFFGFLHEGHFYVPPPYEGVTSFLRRETLPDGSQGRLVQDNTILSTHMGYDEPDYDKNNPVLRGRQPVEEFDYLTEAFTREAVSFIDRHSEEPFFLYLSYNAVHSPMQALQEDVEQFKDTRDIHRRVFAGMLADLDAGIGDVLAKLRAEKIEESTLIFFISDNGGPTRELTSSNDPLRGGKGSLYEGGIRVPFLMQWPAVLPAGTVYRHPVITTDVFATASAVAGRQLPTDRTTDGVNLIPYLTGKQAALPHKTLFWRMGEQTALRTGEWKIVWPRGGDSFELYYLADDLDESRNLAEQHAGKLSRLKSLWQELDAEMVEPVWRPR